MVFWLTLLFYEKLSHNSYCLFSVCNISFPSAFKITNLSLVFNIFTIIHLHVVFIEIILHRICWPPCRCVDLCFSHKFGKFVPYFFKYIFVTSLFLLSFWDSHYMNIRLLDIFLLVIEVLLLSQKVLIFFFPSDLILSNLAISLLDLSSIVSNKLLRLSSHLFILDTVILILNFHLVLFCSFHLSAEISVCLSIMKLAP